jgi:predicted DNA-binding WGR domain protein
MSEAARFVPQGFYDGSMKSRAWGRIGTSGKAQELAFPAYPKPPATRIAEAALSYCI